MIVFNPLSGTWDYTLSAPEIEALFLAQKYIKIPVVTTAQRNALTAAQGMLVFDSDLVAMMQYNGTTWDQLAGAIESSTTVNDGATLTLSKYKQQTVRIAGNSVLATLAGITHTALANGDTVDLVGSSDTYPVTVVAASGLVVNGSCTLGENDVLSLKKVNGNLIEMGRSE